MQGLGSAPERLSAARPYLCQAFAAAAQSALSFGPPGGPAAPPAPPAPPAHVRTEPSGQRRGEERKPQIKMVSITSDSLRAPLVGAWRQQEAVVVCDVSVHTSHDRSVRYSFGSGRPGFPVCLTHFQELICQKVRVGASRCDLGTSNANLGTTFRGGTRGTSAT